MAKPELVVMAAGIGSRYGGVKQIDPVGPSGQIILDYAIYDALRAGFGKVIFVISERIEQVFREKVGRAVEKCVETEYVLQRLDDLPAGFELPADRTKPWGTAHAALAARGAVTGNFALINADDYYGGKSFRILADYLRQAEDSAEAYDYCMVAFELEKTLTEHGHVARGVCTLTDDGCLARVVERTKIQRFGDAVRYSEDGENWLDLPSDSDVSMNMWGFTPSFLAELERRFPAFLAENIDNPKAEYFVPTVVNDLIQEGRAKVRVLHTDEKWFGVTYKQDKAAVVAAIRARISEGIYPEKLWD